MSKITKFAQRVILQKKWWWKLFFWKKYYQLVKESTIKLTSPFTHEEKIIRKAKLYRQKDQKATTVDHVENECDFMGDLPSKKGLKVEYGIKYWVVVKVKP